MNLFYNLVTCNQALNLIFRNTVCFVNQTTYNGISAGIRPIILRICIFICPQIVTEINHIPRTIYIRFSKTITVIPFFHCFIMFFQIIICQHFFNFFVCKTEIFVKLCICNCKCFQIIKSCKNTFF